MTAPDPRDPPSSTIVLIAWLTQYLGLPAAHTLPDVSGWFDTGFVTVPALAGGNPNWYIPERQPVMQVDTWAANRASAGSASVSRKVPFAKANALADRIILGTYPTPPPQLTLPANFRPVWLESIYPVSEIREVPDPVDGYAHYSLDLQIIWIEQTPVI